MATWPTYARLQLPGTTEEETKIVARTEMERGVPRTRRTASDPLVTVSATILFRTRQEENDFRAWYYSSTGAAAGAAWFEWVDPRTNTFRQTRIAELGQAMPLAALWAVSSRQCKLEYVLTT
jgi:hypothetical protein